jgi:hypothetical protein
LYFPGAQGITEDMATAPTIAIIGTKNGDLGYVEISRRPTGLDYQTRHPIGYVFNKNKLQDKLSLLASSLPNFSSLVVFLFGFLLAHLPVRLHSAFLAGAKQTRAVVLVLAQSQQLQSCQSNSQPNAHNLALHS